MQAQRRKERQCSRALAPLVRHQGLPSGVSPPLLRYLTPLLTNHTLQASKQWFPPRGAAAYCPSPRGPAAYSPNPAPLRPASASETSAQAPSFLHPPAFSLAAHETIYGAAWPRWQRISTAIERISTAREPVCRQTDAGQSAAPSRITQAQIGWRRGLRLVALPVAALQLSSQ